MQQNELWAALAAASVLLLLGCGCLAILYFRKDAKLKEEPQGQAVVSCTSHCYNTIKLF